MSDINRPATPAEILEVIAEITAALAKRGAELVQTPDECEKLKKELIGRKSTFTEAQKKINNGYKRESQLRNCNE